MADEAPPAAQKAPRKPRDPGKTWDRAAPAYKALLDHLAAKNNRLTLEYVDLLYVVNFKGGNSRVWEAEAGVVGKLGAYSDVLAQIGAAYQGKRLSALAAVDLETLKALALKFLTLTITKASRISGFGPSFASALLHGCFPDLLPIIDRRVLHGAGLWTPAKSTSLVPAKKEVDLYPKLVDKFYAHILAKPTDTIRDVDRELFVVPFQVLALSKPSAKQERRRGNQSPK